MIGESGWQSDLRVKAVRNNCIEKLLENWPVMYF